MLGPASRRVHPFADRIAAVSAIAMLASFLLPVAPAAAQVFGEEPTPAGGCVRDLTANVIALDQVFFWNRLGAVEPQGMIFALEDDVVHRDQVEGVCPFTKRPLVKGQVRLRKDKRPRPLVLRMNEGDCLTINFQNLLADFQVDQEQPATREASVHVVGMQYETKIEDGGMWVGQSPSGLVSPGFTAQYKIYAEKEGTYLMYSGGANVGGQGDGGSISAGLFGAINVQPRGSRYFRSQVTQKELAAARSDTGTEVFPTIQYDKRFPLSSTDPDECYRLGKPILEMVDGSEIVHSDLTAIITGPNLFGWNSYPFPLDDPTYPHRNEPYREFTIVFHDEIGAVQAFPQFEDRILRHTLHSVRDAFAINYGTGGIGAEILANRLKLGPMADCIDCKYEEFFLASWAVGDPAMIVDKPANFPCGDDSADWKRLREGDHTTCTIQPGKKATKAFYPDDPSNVYHSYMNDRVKFRNLHAGTDDHHIFHLHAHQWLHTPKSKKSSYMDSQAIGQGSSFTYEIAYEGSGNRNKTVGDSIFHCHFYPHFAQGMWSLWRVHDVMELGTELDENGRPIDVDSGSPVVVETRALPDGEIAHGTPIPAIVPLPGKALPPPPTPVRLVGGQIDETYNTIQADAAKTAGSLFFNPGFPFYIPGRAGHRAPHPPFDFAKDGSGNPRDGGLPRHVILNDPNEAYVSAETRLDFHKEVQKVRAKSLPEDGTRLEQLAMETHERRWYPTPAAGGPAPGRQFELNGLPRVAGAPFADPCWDRELWQSVPGPRHYEAVDLELDVIFNKAGWHFPQQRLITLRTDMPATLAGTRPPEPFFFRANSRDCIEYELTNLVPFEYQVDDFQVRTPTDILGQHIHLVKFDVTSSDGGGNGWNYEDGTFSPEEVQERIEAIRALNAEKCEEGAGEIDPTTRELLCPEVEEDPRFGPGPNRNCNDYPDYLGAQTTVQRWWVDPVEDGQGNDRTLRTVFTHDHFGPSTHQQAGLYAGLVIEPEGSTWYHNEQNIQLGTNKDGSPTSWQARILTSNPSNSYREFMLEYADFQLAYEPNQVANACPDPVFGWADPPNAINPPGRKAVEPPVLFEKPDDCPINTNDPDGTWLFPLHYSTPFPPAPKPPCPEAVSADDPGMWLVNYRNEPLALRLGTDPALGTPVQVAGPAGDPSFAYETRTDRANPEFNVLPDGSQLTYVPYPALTNGLHPGDPLTPVMRVYEGDRVQIRTLVGAHEEEHNFSAHGLKWLFEPFDTASGYRNSQMAGISEWFDFVVPPMPNLLGPNEEADFLVKPNSSAEGQWSGVWALLRLYQDSNAPRFAGFDLPALPSNQDGKALDESEKDIAFEEVSEEEVTARTADAETIGSELGSKAVSANNVRVACPPTSFPPRTYKVTAVAAREVLPPVTGLGGQQSLVYNRRGDTVQWWDRDKGTFNGTRSGPLHDPTAILFVEDKDLIYPPGPNPRPTLRPDAPVEPLILRARKGECIKVVLKNDLPDPGPFAFDLPGWSGWLMLIEGFNANEIAPSREVGLHPQLVQYDLTRADGANVGRNVFHHGKQTVAPGETITYFWYAGEVTKPQGGPFQIRPLELGTTGLSSSDTLEHAQKGAIGALIIEPADADWTSYINDDRHQYLDPNVEAARRTRAETLVTHGNQQFREYVTFFQDDVNLRYSDAHPDWMFEPVENLTVNEDPTESGQKGFGYRTEPIWFRMGWSPNAPQTFTRDQQFAPMFTDAQVGDRPVTHIFDAEPGQPVRFRTVHVGGHTQNHVFEVQGHLWPERPFNADSSTLQQQTASEYQGTRHGVGPTCHYDALIKNGAGGKSRIPGEYLYRDYVAWGTSSGIWGLFNVEAGSTPLPGSGGAP